MSAPLNIVVIGAGICGLSSAIWLRRAGHEVTLIDKDAPGAGASYGNAGLLAQWGIVPINTPGLGRNGLKYLADRDAPLFMQWRHFPKLIPWLLKLLSHANDDGVRHMSSALHTLLGDSLAQHQALTRGTDAARFVAPSDFIYTYESRAAFDADKYTWTIRQEAGYGVELIEGAAVQEVEPILNPEVTCLALTKGHGHILDPGGYMQALADVLQAEGGHYRQAEARDFILKDGRISSIVTSQGNLPCDAAVLTAGIWSKPLMHKLGLAVPLEVERGHHLHFRNPSDMPRTPMMIAKGKFVATPMSTGLRCAGTVELGGLDSTPSRAPLALIEKFTKWAFPDLTYEAAEEWVGFRPSTPDSLPLIGEIGATGVHAAFGHQHIGLTGGPKTGRWVADMISGKRPNLDLAPFDAGRFAR
ncbi:FAD-binding oxidoreductase [Roseovarius faecimaris]|uniref:FAD-binding oxidoreductase n=1 Tax=Roseovarius faecimaris TaxID=2494550 RepID=A0A6I6IKY8_9RHOB|nr:FAD-binding oxidoreductase [Roseovarius faecimaris]QGX96952.1 FAD-binding oxidoreductase [Roseovarius faecimaris]